MNVTIVLILISSLALISYAFELVNHRIKVPSVVLLIFLGLIIGMVANSFDFQVPYLKSILPPLGTIGLILIVLEGGLDLKITKESIPILLKTFMISLILLVACLFSIAGLFSYVYDASYNVSLVNALPFSIISSSVAIAGVKSLAKKDQEFVIYESSFSDILGIMLFNTLLSLQGKVALSSAATSFIVELLLILAISIVSCLGLIILIDRIKHSLKYLPIFFVLLFLYGITKYVHLSPLITVLLLGLLMNNIESVLLTLNSLPLIKGKVDRLFRSENIANEIKGFKMFIIEATFLVKTFFFLIFGYTIDLVELENIYAISISLGILIIILFTRFLYLKYISKFNVKPLIYIAPRGLITLLLFLSIPDSLKIPFFDEGIAPIVVILSSLIMTYGTLTYRKEKDVKAKSIVI